MYSRYPDRLPEHYSGCAFRRGQADRAPINVPFEEMPPTPPPPPPKEPPAPKPSGCAPFEGIRPTLPIGLDGDELLLLGLILLLARSEEGADLLPWLALLLFCK